MSQYFTNENELETESKLSLVVRKPQEGKTSICIKYITDDLLSNNIHIVLTMNTLASGMQFFGRMKDQIGADRIVVFNSVKKTAGDCHYAKDVIAVKSLITNKNYNIKVIVCCAHNKKIRESLIQLIEELTDSFKFREQNNKIVFHIDEAHKYIPENRKFITAYNNSSAVTEIIGYSATADGIWTQNRDDPLFYNILIRDVDAQLGLLRSPHYFGVNRCELIAYDDYNNDDLINLSEISNEISQITFENSGTKSSNNKWFGTRSHFNIGNEILFLSFIKYILPILNISNDTFSYNFMPSYNRKVTHYECMELILKQYSNANVIIMNGKGQQLYRLNQSTGRSYKITDNVEINQNAYLASEKNALLEPSYMIQQLIKNTPNCPTFITGFTCVGMSVTLINENIGNFDNVVMDHQHFKRDTLYQLCRFLFKYEYWTPENQDKIKTTKFHSLTTSVINTCIEYEEHIEKICNEFAGTTCTLNQINGKEPEEPTEKELKTNATNSVSLINNKLWQRFKVCDGNDTIQWEQAEEFYKKFHPNHKGFTGRTKPTKNDNGFYECTDSGKKGVKHLSCFTKFLEKDKWSNFMAPKKGILSYVRAFVGYDNINDSTEYTIFIKYAQLVDNEHNNKVLNDYYDLKKEQTKEEEEEDC